MLHRIIAVKVCIDIPAEMLAITELDIILLERLLLKGQTIHNAQLNSS